MSMTYIGAIAQFLVTFGIITADEAATVTDGLVALVSLVTLGITLWGRFRLGDTHWWGGRK